MYQMGTGHRKPDLVTRVPYNIRLETIVAFEWQISKTEQIIDQKLSILRVSLIVQRMRFEVD